jgi:hypothetical protein
MAEQLIGSELADGWIEAGDIPAHRRVQIEFSFERQAYHRRRGEHLGSRAQAEKHIGRQWSAGIHAGKAVSMGENYLIAQHYCHGRAGSLARLQLLQRYTLDERGIELADFGRCRECQDCKYDNRAGYTVHSFTASSSDCMGSRVGTNSCAMYP